MSAPGESCRPRASVCDKFLASLTLNQSSKEIANEWSMILGGLLYFVFGLFLLGRPFVSAVALVWMFGILALGGGLTLVMVAFNLRKVGQEGQTYDFA